MMWISNLSHAIWTRLSILKIVSDKILKLMMTSITTCDILKILFSEKHMLLFKSTTPPISWKGVAVKFKFLGCG